MIAKKQLLHKLCIFILISIMTALMGADQMVLLRSKNPSVHKLAQKILKNNDEIKVYKDAKRFYADLELAYKESNDPSVILELNIQRRRIPLKGIYEISWDSFEPLTQEHVTSPQYSLKCGSDSASLGIEMHQEWKNRFSGKFYEMKLMDNGNEQIPENGLSQWSRLSIFGATVYEKEFLQSFFESLQKSLKNAANCDDYKVIGMLHKPWNENLEAELHEFIAIKEELNKHEKQERKEKMNRVVQKMEPFSSGLFYFSGLKKITPYFFNVIDHSQTPKDYFYKREEGRFVTASVEGHVRTVPGIYPERIGLKTGSLIHEKISAKKKLDYVIENVRVVDGTKNAEPYIADVGVSGDKIAAIGNLKSTKRKKTIEGSEKILCPGFIDIHSHGDWNIAKTKYAPSHIRQGITTILGGNCASSRLDIGTLLQEVDALNPPLNFGMLIGNKSIRKAVLGKRKGMFPYSELYRQKELMDLAMEEGAFGLSSGLIYSISEEAFAWELAEIAKQIKPYGGFYASHIRGESDEVLDAAREAIYIGEIAEVPVQISHMKVLGKRNWGKMQQYLEIMETAQRRGLDVKGDQYPWEASGPAAHYSLHRLIVREGIRKGNPEVILLKDMPGRFAPYSGKNLKELLEKEDMTCEELIDELKLTRSSPVYATYLCIGKEDIRRAIKKDFVMVCTDSSFIPFSAMEKENIDNEHPRKLRTYQEYLSKYIRDEKLLDWGPAIYKCTGLPASRMKLTDRGTIHIGNYADLVLFDPEKLDPGTDYRNQNITPKGMDWVFVNGCPSLANGKMTRENGGKVLYGYGNRKP